MTQKIVYGRDTGSIEDYSQCVVVLFPDDMDGDEIEEILDSDRRLELECETITTVEHVMAELQIVLGMNFELPKNQVAAIMAALAFRLEDTVQR